jgi:protease I
MGQQGQTSSRRRTPRASRFKTVQLPEANTSSAVSFERALSQQYQSMELPSNQALKFAEISQLLWAAQGVTIPRIEGGPAPNLEVPMRLYVALPDGLYRYNPLSHTMEQTSDRDVRTTMAATLINQPAAPTGGCQMVIAGSSRDFSARFGTRARTVMLLQAGEMAQNLKLQTAALGLTYVSIENVDTGSVRRICRLSRGLEPHYVAFVGYPASETPSQSSTETPTDVNKKVVMVAPQQGFHDEELFGTKRLLEQASVQVLVASNRLGVMVGELGNTTQADVLLNQVNVSQFDGLIFVGGQGAVAFFNNPVVMNLVQQASAQQKVLAASGNAPTILANAGVLRGKRATAFLSERSRIAQGGAVYTGEPVERADSIVTSTGPLAVAAFAQAVLEALGGY